MGSTIQVGSSVNFTSFAELSSPMNLFGSRNTSSPMYLWVGNNARNFEKDQVLGLFVSFSDEIILVAFVINLLVGNVEGCLHYGTC